MRCIGREDAEALDKLGAHADGPGLPGWVCGVDCGAEEDEAGDYGSGDAGWLTFPVEEVGLTNVHQTEEEYEHNVCLSLRVGLNTRYDSHCLRDDRGVGEDVRDTQVCEPCPLNWSVFIRLGTIDIRDCSMCHVDGPMDGAGIGKPKQRIRLLPRLPRQPGER